MRRSKTSTRGRLRPAFVTTLAMSVVACSSSSGGVNASSAAAAGGAGTGAGATGGSAAGTGEIGGMSSGGSSGQSAAGTASPGGQSSLAGASNGGAAGSVEVVGSAGSGGTEVADPCSEQPPLMNDPCPMEALECDYAGGGPCEIVATCMGGRWALQTVGVDSPCNPPNPCPDEEPTLGAMCIIIDALDAAQRNCRYPHGACFDYWSCTGDFGAYTYQSSPTPHSDACCPDAQPVNGTSCPGAGAVCTYDETVVSCDGTSWSVVGSGGAGGSG